MEINDKVLVLNKASQDIRDALRVIMDIYRDNNDISTRVWQVNKAINLMQQLICQNLEENVIRTEFDKIIENVNVEVDGKSISIFDLTEEKNADEAIAILKTAL